MNWKRRGINFDSEVYDKIIKNKPANLSLSKYICLLCSDQMGGKKLDKFFFTEEKKMPKLTDAIEFWEDWADSQDKDVVLSVFKKTHCISGVMGGKICT